jgi:hypothetical protein
VGNFGDGRINAFNPTTGQFLGQLSDASGQPFANIGIWAMTFGNGAGGTSANTLYFNAGINQEADGIFASISPAPVVPFSSAPATRAVPGLKAVGDNTVAVGTADARSDGAAALMLRSSDSLDRGILLATATAGANTDVPSTDTAVERLPLLATDAESDLVASKVAFQRAVDEGHGVAGASSQREHLDVLFSSADPSDAYRAAPPAGT